MNCCSRDSKIRMCNISIFMLFNIFTVGVGKEINERIMERGFLMGTNRVNCLRETNEFRKLMKLTRW